MEFWVVKSRTDVPESDGSNFLPVVANAPPAASAVGSKSVESAHELPKINETTWLFSFDESPISATASDRALDSSWFEIASFHDSVNLPAISSGTLLSAQPSQQADAVSLPPPESRTTFHNPSATPIASLDAPPVWQIPDTDADGIPGVGELGTANRGDGNGDGIADHEQPNVASLRSASGEFVTLESPGHSLRNVHNLAASVSERSTLPFGLFNFEIHDVTPGGAATVCMILPDDARPSGYVKQDPATGKLQPFAFDGRTGAQIDGNIITLHFVDGGRGDADGVANGVIVDPGGPSTTPFVALLAVDPTSAKFKIDNITGISTGAFGVFRAGDVSEALTVNYTVDGFSTAVGGQDYQALSGSVTIAAGLHSAPIIIRPLDNASGESTKSVRVALSESSNYLIVDPNPAQVNIAETATIHPEQIEVTGDKPSIGIYTLDANAAEFAQESSTGLHLVNRSALILNPPGTTWTHPAPITPTYTVDGSAAANLDYIQLSGTAPLPYAVYAAPIWITPLDDTNVEGDENVTVTLQPDSNYYIIPPETATVTIYDDEAPPLDPIANADNYAMSVEQSSLIVNPEGVLANDYFFSPGQYHAEIVSQPSYGTVVLNANGSFTYTPGETIRETGGHDSFWYVSVQNDRRSAWRPVGVDVVDLKITTPAVAHNQNMTVGAFVPINANNDNGSTVTHEIPILRDFDAGPWNTEAFNDPDLIPVTVAVNPNAGLNGTFTILVANHGISEIKLWREPFKLNRAEGMYTQANLPQTFYMEGVKPGAALGESIVSVRYISAGGNGNLWPVTDQLKATVTPVVEQFSITPGPVVFINPNDGTEGMRAGTATVPGATFDAIANRKNLSGNLAFIQNISVVENDYDGAGAGVVYRSGWGPNKNVVLINGATFPILDKDPNSSPPDYIYHLSFPDTGDPNTQRITADDLPAIQESFVNSRAIIDFDIRMSLKMHLVWRFGSPGTGIVYSLARAPWQVRFRATASANGPGWVDTNLSPNGVFAWPFELFHNDPIVAPPVWNVSHAFVNA